MCVPNYTHVHQSIFLLTYRICDVQLNFSYVEMFLCYTSMNRNLLAKVHNDTGWGNWLGSGAHEINENVGHHKYSSLLRCSHLLTLIQIKQIVHQNSIQYYLLLPTTQNQAGKRRLFVIQRDLKQQICLIRHGLIIKYMWPDILCHTFRLNKKVCYLPDKAL